MLDEYLPRQGPAFEEWLEKADAVGARIEPEKIFTFHMATTLARPLTLGWLIRSTRAGHHGTPRGRT